MIRSAVALAICLVALPDSLFAQELVIPPPQPPADVAIVPVMPPPEQAPIGQGPTGQGPAGAPTGQGPTGQPPGRAPRTTPPPTPSAQVPAAVPAPPPPRKIRGRDVNVQVELTITEHQGTAPGEKRVVSMIVADAAFGRIRSTASQDVKLNIDATPTILENDRIALELTIEYIPITPEGAARRPAGLLEMLTVILVNGKPMLISQAADPTIDRRITAEVRATVLK